MAKKYLLNIVLNDKDNQSKSRSNTIEKSRVTIEAENNKANPALNDYKYAIANGMLSFIA